MIACFLAELGIHLTLLVMKLAVYCVAALNNEVPDFKLLGV